MILYERLSKDSNGREFLKTRELITNIFYGLSMIGYIIFWIFTHPSSSPTLSTYLTCLLCPVFTFGLFMRSYYYLFLYNWFYSLYLFVTLVTFFIVSINIPVPEYTHYLIYEVGHVMLALVGGVLVSILVSVPFKIIQFQFMNSNDLYYNTTILTNLEQYVFPERFKEKKEKTKFDTFNETQLQVELKNAIKEDRFEDAERIKKILEEKFR